MTDPPFTRQASADSSWLRDKKSAIVVDFEKALARLDGNRGLLLDMIVFFREDVPQLVCELETALAEGNASRVKRSAHSIKGLASSFEALRVTRQAQEIEELAARDQLEQVPHCLSNLRTHIAELLQAFIQYDRENSSS